MERKENRGWRQRLAARYGSASQRGGSCVVLQGQRRVTVYDCRKILEYSPKEIRLAVMKCTLSVVGEELFCPSFSAGTVTVEGYITGVTYLVSDT
ncbi:MAG: YabP/YqfC family sporulation protein [Clostridia bacterium]|nr:YabP/YqfC family sporulation protein [Clostridia bacterium]